ncbi:MAG: DUF1579 domain-containing protein [Acidobacteria bacterium]|nr:MAG: DUF1579 domain-containing protein [Acidobacteriota bacterium]
MSKRFAIPILTCVLVAAAAWADEQEMSSETPEQSAELAAAMETMAKLAAPGEHHEHIAKLAGNWTYRSTMWPAPGQPPIESEGTLEARMILGGRFLESTYKGDFMGTAFEGRGIDGYDNYTQKHTAYWIDSMGTMNLTFSGDCSDDHKVTTMEAAFVDPMTGQPMKFRSVTTLVDDDHFTFEAYMVSPEGEFKSMRLEASRKK